MLKQSPGAGWSTGRGEVPDFGILGTQLGLSPLHRATLYDSQQSLSTLGSSMVPLECCLCGVKHLPVPPLPGATELPLCPWDKLLACSMGWRL